MTDIQPPIRNDRSASAPRMGAPSVQPAESVPSMAQGQARIVYGYWVGAVVLGLAIWAAIFFLAL
ncbi:hypothetical protein [Sphingobium boeckii]|uniref:Uncharacterized protein n=1 Tax=Sphingobium boeckii TaxID=1082345 RepID=A0A7W9EE87_9SPHN|nr:hypothetical protein [Sphingobium boeckii]MBB5685759.1 hypothetical protein [Sphingobium boeckii]